MRNFRAKCEGSLGGEMTVVCVVTNPHPFDKKVHFAGVSILGHAVVVCYF